MEKIPEETKQPGNTSLVNGAPKTFFKGTEFENIEKEKLLYCFDIRQKHPQSEKIYGSHEENEVDGKGVKLETIDNPFAALEGKELLHDGIKIGVFHIRKEDSFYQCIYTADGGTDCGVFFQIEINVKAQNLDMQSAIDEVVLALENKNIDYMKIEEGFLDDSGDICRNNFCLIDTKKFLTSPPAK